MIISSIALNVFVLAMLGWVWLRQRHVFLMPSTWVLLLSALFYMLPALVFIDEISELSPFTWTATIYCTAFVGTGLLINVASPAPALSRRPWSGRAEAGHREQRRVGRHLAAVLAILAVITLWYLTQVPLSSTGLFGLLLDPENYAQMREESLKLIDSVALQYAYLIGFSCLSPLAFALLLERVAALGIVRGLVLATAVMVFLSFYLLLTGARVGLINLAVVGLFYALLTNRMRIGWKTLALAVVVAWLAPVALSMIRERGRTDAGVLEFVVAIGDRIFLLPLLISGWFVEFAETRGHSGLAGALGLGQQTDWTNEIALEFLGRREDVTIETVAAPSSFFFTNYLYFGWLGLLPSVIALKLMDWPVRYLSKLPDALMRPLAATILYFSVIFVRAGFGVTLVSHGYVVLVLIVLLAVRREWRPGA